MFISFVSKIEHNGLPVSNNSCIKKTTYTEVIALRGASNKGLASGMIQHEPTLTTKRTDIAIEGNQIAMTN